MMKLFTLFLVTALAVTEISGELSCENVVNIPTKWIDLKGDCLIAMRDQVKKEFEASYVYLAMGAHFSRDTVNRPGFADFFFKSAGEEREHGLKLIEYLSMRGMATNNLSELFQPYPTQMKTTWSDGISALEAALELEVEVTGRIRDVIKRCEKSPNYYHLVDYLTGVYLEEQLKGERDLAGKLATLKKMTGTSAYRSDAYAMRTKSDQTGPDSLAEFLFDKEL